ncbi:uncharacterized protein BO96DRAFT_360285 [Aspergillus niger CBS 101883]|uniref:Uncharacterized protein n=3 Tax=Aspergillus niger TaxID=5061 RepID=A2QJC9_ASPNC|nr:uncharacterized protein BO96DRAFT_360285 [Aspergillus niger CBS 101883]XP_059603618.1 hypothetical protein An04g06610 [Aspergillus niger]PYH59262.1 hypothetical protein BO96DRAFT_360285 [Aspergillus niger CBS 101883]RDH14344.1 hypothetical protein M747DRAFT_249828 [Aspergillus niger ATCC 13496]CAK44664.1 hypothetical protein An04g06610 [Aspergillus niger]
MEGIALDGIGPVFVAPAQIETAPDPGQSHQKALFTTSGPRQSTTPSIDQCKQRARRTVREGTSGREESSSMPYTGGGQEGKKKKREAKNIMLAQEHDKRGPNPDALAWLFTSGPAQKRSRTSWPIGHRNVGRLSRHALEGARVDVAQMNPGMEPPERIGAGGLLCTMSRSSLLEGKQDATNDGRKSRIADAMMSWQFRFVRRGIHATSTRSEQRMRRKEEHDPGEFGGLWLQLDTRWATASSSLVWLIDGRQGIGSNVGEAQIECPVNTVP